jgi:myosin heavy subunit
VHFADTVTYEIDGFLAKNTDAAPAAITEVYTRPLTDRQAASLCLRTCLLGS